MKKTAILSFFLLVCGTGSAQKSHIDSLLAKIDHAGSIKNLASAMDELLATPKGDIALLKKGKQDLADAQASGNLMKQRQALVEICRAAFYLHDTPELLNASLQGILVSRNLSDNKLLGDFLHQAGLANNYQHETHKGINYTFMAAAAHRAAGDIHSELNDYSNIESSYVDLKMADSALIIANLEMGILNKINKTRPNYWNAYRTAIGDLGEALACSGRPDSALIYYIKSYRAVKKSSENIADFPYLINNLAKTYLVLGKRDSAAKYALESYGLASKTKLWEFTADAASILAKVYEGRDDKKSVYYLKEQLAANDSINASDRAKQFQLITEKERQRKDDLKAEKERFNTRIRLYIVISAAIILLIIGIILWRNNKRQKHTNQLLSEQKEEISAQRDNLEHQNHELEIEAALERVRTIAMGMSKADDMLEVCKTISQQLELLGLKEIRNVQTAIFSDERATYMNYEHYARHDKDIVTETSYVNNEKHAEFAEQMQKGYGLFFELHIPQTELEDWLEYQKTTNVFIDTHLENAASLNYYWHSLATVALGISTYVPLTDEEKALFTRFLKVFELSYKRYLDIRQADEQAREAQIQLALERVRASTMAMQRSEELAETVFVLFQQFKELGENPDQATIGIFNEEERVIDYWVTMHGSQNNKVYKFSIDEPDVTRKIYDAWKAQKSSLVIDLSGKPLLDFMKYRESMGGAPAKPDEKRRIINVAIFSKGLINVQSTVERSEESIKLLERFAQVFEQTYTRFLDLQKAEAQAREAQIEAALERVRSKTMAMHNSKDIAETSVAMFQELVTLGVESTVRCGVAIISGVNELEVWTASSKEDHSITLNIGQLSMAAHPLLLHVFNAWQNKESSTTYELNSDGVRSYFQVLNDAPGYPFQYPMDSLPEKWGINAFFFKEGCLFAFTGEPLSVEMSQLFKRFAGVFGQTYTRFLDLQKAEKQAKEAQIEAALERTRTQSVIMQHSNELDDTLRVFHEQVLNLGIDSAFSFLWLPDEEKDRHIFWAAWAENASKVFNSKAIDYPLDKNEPATAQCLVDWKGKDPVVSYRVPPDGVENYFAAWQELVGGVENLAPKHFKEGLYYVEAFMRYGCFGVIVQNPLSNEEKKILGRFAIEFERTYTRFLDLQKAEAQAKEAQIETALERVRSRTLAMQKSDELAETAAVLFRQMISLGIEPNRLYIGITKDDSAEIEFWITDEDGSKVSNMFTGDADKNISMKKMYDAWKVHQKSIVIDMYGDELTEYFHYLGEILNVPFKDGLTQKRRVQYISYFSNGFIGMASPDDQPQETVDLLDRFAYVFNLTFARFNDLKIAELHAIQAEQDLIEIKAARQHAEEALTDLRAAQKQLVQSEKMASLGELTAGIAHEIQNPLNFVNNFSEVSAELIDEMTEELDKGDIEEVKAIAGDIRDNLEKIRHHGKRADGIVKGMLQHSRASSGQKEPTDLNALVDEYLRLSYHGLRAKDKSFNAELVTSFDKGLPKVSVVPQDMGRVILNLINNAFYATQQKQKTAGSDYKPAVEVKTQVSDDQVLISVKDNGIGIPDAIKDKIMQPFFTTKPTGEGTGLGLSLSYDIVVKSHGGNILINSAEGNGSEFIINLPLKP